MEQINLVWLAEGIESCRKKGYGLELPEVKKDIVEQEEASHETV